MKRYILLLIVILAIIGCQPTGQGTMEGKISIGPLCPVERNPPDPNCQATQETYNAWPIGIYSGNTKIDVIKGDADGRFMIQLPAGNYMLELERQRGFGATNLPMEFIIQNGKITRVNITVDTGIR